MIPEIYWLSTIPCLGLSCSTQISHAQHVTIQATCFAETLNLEATAPTQNQQHGMFFSSEAKEDDEEKVGGESEKARISFRILTTFEDMYQFLKQCVFLVGGPAVRGLCHLRASAAYGLIFKHRIQQTATMWVGLRAPNFCKGSLLASTHASLFV